MRVYLMFREGAKRSDFGINPFTGDLKSDLELEHILNSMAKGDKTILNICEYEMFNPLLSQEAIEYRHGILADALRNPSAVRRLYAIVSEADSIRRAYMSYTSLAEGFLNAVELLKAYLKLLRDLREVADRKLQDFKSRGFKDMLEMLKRELTDEYFEEVSNSLREINNVDNILVSARLGSHLQSVDYTLRRKEKGFWLRWCTATSFTANVERNPKEIDDIFNRRERAVSEAANILTWAARHLESFFNMLRNELGFYVGCLNLADEVQKIGMPICIPALLPVKSDDRSWCGLYDMSLALMTGAPVVGNELDVKGKHLYIITGANQGGKSTFLRSIGQAQLMAQCGMPVGADSFTVPIRHGVFTHFKRDEDSYMKSGRLDEELERMSKIIKNIKSGSMLLMNESFNSTNEREGSEICRQITQALIDSGVEVMSVTHMYIYATAFLEDSGVQYLCAERREDTERTFKIIPGEPMETAFGEDLYQKIFVQAGKSLEDWGNDNKEPVLKDA
ncbi:MAG: DNA mismatch repair protein MutS [Clostridiales bacterium]|jgi:DNA mismatch repair ATPase MutS|nr:DNA mismatch repair protein MutS [Clostridiales bacterium]